MIIEWLDDFNGRFTVPGWKLRFVERICNRVTRSPTRTMPAHQMRLRGPWDVRSRTGDPLAGPFTSKLPATWEDVLGDRTEPVTWRRRFHSPTGIEPGDRLVIVLEQIAGVTGVRVNGTPLREQRRAPQVCEYEFTQLLAPANILEIEQERVLNGEHPAGLWTPVILEIIPAADTFM